MGEIVVPDDESDVVPRDGIDTDEHNDLIAADDYEHEDNFATCIQANIVAALEASDIVRSMELIISGFLPVCSSIQFYKRGRG